MDRRSRRSMSMVSVIQIALLAFLVAFTFASPLLTPARAATTYYVEIMDFAFSPTTITIQPGDTVQWNNTGPSPHTSTSDATSTEVWDSGNMNVGATFSHTFNTAGSFAYHCTYHSSMHGTVVVGAIPEFSSIGVVAIGLLGLMIGITALTRRR